MTGGSYLSFSARLLARCLLAADCTSTILLNTTSLYWSDGDWWTRTRPVLDVVEVSQVVAVVILQEDPLPPAHAAVNTEPEDRRVKWREFLVDSPEQEKLGGLLGGHHSLVVVEGEEAVARE